MAALSQDIDVGRRRSLALLAAVGATGLAASGASAATAGKAWASSFAPYDGPFGKHFSGVVESTLRLEGRLPAALTGTFYRNGPARIRLGTTSYTHWFDGDGMVQAFRFHDGSIRHRGVLLRTPKMREEEEAGRFLYNSFGSRIAGAKDVHNADQINVANINTLSLNGGKDVYALWEGGSALQLDPQTLEAKGFKIWSPETQGAPFSAHPRMSPDGTVWNFGYMPGSGKLIIYRISKQGELLSQAVIDAPQADMVHDFAVTERYLVFLLMPVEVSKDAAPGTAFSERLTWKADAPMIAMTVDKASLATRRYEPPNAGVFHLGNAWEEGGVIRLSYVRHGDVMTLLRQGVDARPQVDPDYCELELDLSSGKAVQHAALYSQVEFPAFDRRYTGKRTGLTLMMQRTAGMPDEVVGMNTVLALRNGKADRFVYGVEWIAEEHIHVPAPGHAKEGSGWVIGTAYDWKNERTALSVFDADGLSKGPVCRAHLPYALPLGLHGQFVA